MEKPAIPFREPIGIIGAMHTEVELLIEELEDAHALDKGGMTLHAGMLEGCSVVVAQCGVGKVNAAACTQTVVDAGVGAVVSTGAAGALGADLEIGDFAVATGCVQHDVDLTALGYELGQVPGSPVVLPVDAPLSSRLESSIAASGVHVVRGCMATGDMFVCDVADRQRIYDAFGAVCCDMETAAIAQVCHARGVPFAAVRAISDKADGAQPESYDAFEDAAAHASSRAVHTMLAAIGDPQPRTSDNESQDRREGE